MVSVIVPNYNHAKFLKDRIDSILSQDYQDFELIILDDLSSDNSRDVIDEYFNHPKVSGIFYNKENSGSTFLQWRRGIEKTRGDLVWIAESDDYADEKFLSKVVQPLLNDEKTVLSFCQSYRYDSNENITGDWFDHLGQLEDANVFKDDFLMSGYDFVKNYMIPLNAVPNASAVVFRKAAYLKTDQPNISIDSCEDWYTWLKIALQGDVAYTANKLNYFRYHPDSVISRSLKNMIFKKNEIILRKQLEKYFSSNKLFELLSKNKKYLIRDYGYEANFQFKRHSYLKTFTYYLRKLILKYLGN